MLETMSAHRYEITFKSAMMWATAELEHVGRIASMKDADLQHAYAKSTLNGMAHLKDALYELVTDPAYEKHYQDLQRTHDAVVRTMRYLKKTYNLDVDVIRAFNTRQTLSNLGYLEEAGESVGNAETPESSETPEANMESESPEYQPKDTIERMQDGGRRRSYKKRRSSRKGRKTQSRK